MTRSPAGERMRHLCEVPVQSRSSFDATWPNALLAMTVTISGGLRHACTPDAAQCPHWAPRLTPGRPLPSAGVDLTYWDVQINTLRSQHDVDAFDLPGRGRSRASSSDITLEAMTGALVHAVQGLDAGPVHLFGLSVGGILAQNITITTPTLLASLSILNTAARFGDAGRQTMRRRAHRVERYGWPAPSTSSSITGSRRGPPSPAHS